MQGSLWSSWAFLPGGHTLSSPGSPGEEDTAFFCSQVSQISLLHPPWGLEPAKRQSARTIWGTLLPPLPSISPAQVIVSYWEVRGTEDMSSYLLLQPSYQSSAMAMAALLIQSLEFDCIVIWILLWVSNKLASALIGVGCVYDRITILKYYPTINLWYLGNLSYIPSQSNQNVLLIKCLIF